MEHLNQGIKNLFDAKNKRRNKLAHMSFPEKIKAIIKMQQMVAPIMKKKGQHPIIWTPVS